MTNTLKRTLGITLIMVLLIAFAGCGIFENQPSVGTKNDVDNTQITSEDAGGDTDGSQKDNTDVGTEDDQTPAEDNENDTTKSEESKKSIVIYFSRTNNTERVAGFIKELTDSDSYEILAKVPYTDDDIKYYTDCRADREQNDPTARPEIGSQTIDLSVYDVIYLGYPIWHGQAPKIMYTFVESYNLSGKTIVPFCTSASSGIGSSATNLSISASSATWLTGKRFSSSSSKNEVTIWLSSLNINQ